MLVETLRQSMTAKLSETNRPQWKLSEFFPDYSADPPSGRLRQALLVFAAALPGEVVLEDDDPDDKALLDQALENIKKWHFAPDCCHISGDFFDLTGYYGKECLVYGSGDMMFLNLSKTESAGLPDGMVLFASVKNPFEGYNPCSDNDPIAPETCVYFAHK
jgi:hypothetical protein